MAHTAGGHGRVRIPATPGWLAPVTVGLAGVAVTAAVGTMDPEVRGHLTPGCPFRALTGLDCPGCGGTRALYALTQGDMGSALDHNLVMVLALPVLAVAWLAWFRFRLGRRPAPLVIPATGAYGIAAVLAGFFIARNLPWAPFAWLASGAG